MKKNSIIEKLLYFIFAIYAVTLFANTTAIYLEYDYVEKIVKFIRYGCYLVFAIKAIYLFVKEKNISIANVIFFIISVLVLVFGRSTEFLILFFAINALRDLEFKKIIKIGLILYSILFILTIVLSHFGIVPNWVFHRQETLRYSLGFIYPTDLMSVYVTIVLLYFYTRNIKAKYIELIALEGIAIILFKYTDGRLGLVMTTMIIVLLAISKILSSTKLLDKIKINSDKLKKIGIILLKSVPIIFLIATVLVSFLYRYDIKVINWVDHIISQRILLNSEAMQKYPIEPFGSNVDWIGMGGQYNVAQQDLNYNYVDMSYLRILFDYGIVGALFIIYAYIKAIGHCIEKDEKITLMCIFIILIWGLIEPVIFSISRNLFIIYLGQAIARGRNKKLLVEDTRRDV